MPCFMAVVGFVLFKKLLWDLVDEVHDGGDYLLEDGETVHNAFFDRRFVP